MKPFNCDQCGACCRSVHGILPSNEKGHCLNLIDNKCAIYATRPEICDVSKCFNHFGEGMSWEQFCDVTKKSCYELRAREVING